jgi:Domain of unknown function (DUF3488).
MSAAALPSSPHLDIRNVSWLLAAMAFVIAPHLLRLPYWIALFCVAVLGWRAGSRGRRSAFPRAGW